MTRWKLFGFDTQLSPFAGRLDAWLHSSGMYAMLFSLRFESTPKCFVFETLENVVQSEEESSIDCKDSRKSEMSGLMDVSWDTSTGKWLEEVDDFIRSTQEIRRNERKKTVSNSPRVFGLLARERVQPKLQLSRRICSVRAPSTYGQWKSSTKRINCLRCGRKCGKS